MVMEISLTTEALILFFVSGLLIWYIRFHWKRRRLYELAALFNGPPTLPFIGNALELLIPQKEMMAVLLRSTSKCKSPTRLWIGSHLAICIWNPEDLEIILNSQHALSKDPYLYKTLEPLTGTGLVVLPVDQWKRHRRLILPTFYKKNVESYINIFWVSSEALVDTLNAKLDKGLFDVYTYLFHCSLDTILATSLGSDGTKHSSQNHHITDWIDCMLANFTKKICNIFYQSEFIFGLSSAGREFHETKNNYKNYIASMVQFYKAELNKKRYIKDDIIEEGALNKPRTFLEYLLYLDEETDEKFTDEELHGEVQTLLVAALETSSTALAFTLIILGIFPEIQEKLHQEIKQVLGNDSATTYETLKNLNYMERVIKEVLRLFPVSVGLARESDKEIQLTNHIVPANTTILIGTLPLHRDPNIWPNPTKFDPDRFLPEEVAKRHPYSYMPFSAGPRNCIGTVYAWMFMKITVTNIIRNFRIATCYKSIEDIHITMNLALTPTNGRLISITKRV